MQRIAFKLGTSSLGLKASLIATIKKEFLLWKMVFIPPLLKVLQHT